MDDPEHRRLEWAAMLADSQPGLDPFWRAAFLADALLEAPGPAPHGESLLAQASRQLPVLASDGDPLGVFFGPILASAENNPDAPVPVPDYQPGTPNWDELPEGAVALSGFIWAEVEPGVWRWVLLYIFLDGSRPDGYLVVEPTEDDSSTVEDPKLCCCPLRIRIVGGHSSGSYELDLTAEEKEQNPDCIGVTFRVEVDVEWIECEEFEPCTLKWFEKSNVLARNRASEQYYNAEIDEYRAAALTDNRVQSPTLVPWARNMDVDHVGVDAEGEPLTQANREAEHERLRAQRAAKLTPGVQTLPGLVDSPCYDGSMGDWKTNATQRDLFGRIVVEAGCPEGECEFHAIEAQWAQSVRLHQGEVVHSFFSHWPPWTSHKPGAKNFRSTWRGTGGVAWERPLKRFWRKRSRSVSSGK